MYRIALPAHMLTIMDKSVDRALYLVQPSFQVVLLVHLQTAQQTNVLSIVPKDILQQPQPNIVNNSVPEINSLILSRVNAP